MNNNFKHCHMYTTRFIFSVIKLDLFIRALLLDRILSLACSDTCVVCELRTAIKKSFDASTVSSPSLTVRYIILLLSQIGRGGYTRGVTSTFRQVNRILFYSSSLFTHCNSTGCLCCSSCFAFVSSRFQFGPYPDLWFGFYGTVRFWTFLSIVPLRTFGMW